MAAPLRQTFKNLVPICRSLKWRTNKAGFQYSLLNHERRFSDKPILSHFVRSKKSGLRSTISLSLSLAAVGSSAALFYLSCRYLKSKLYQSVLADSLERPEVKISRQVRIDTDNSGLKLTLYQFQTCPFCCKVRALLDYYGFSYDVVEVNSVTKKQIKWSDYRKVPIIVAQMPGSSEEIILRDSTVIVSVLESYLHDRSTSLTKFNSFYPCVEEQVGRRTKYEFTNKYFIMFQEKGDLGSTAKQRNEERKWRKWADDHLVHMLSPNVYRTTSEALQAFNYFSDVGEWEKNFTTMERHTVIYVGAAVMYIMGYFLKNKYKLKDDVRQSLYDSCDEWVKAVGKNRKFMGGDQPNLADLAVYGVLNSIEGCTAFQETLDHTKIGPWYSATKEFVGSHQGSHPLNSKTTPSKIKEVAKK